MKYSIQFLKIKCSQTTRRVTRSDMKDSSIKLRMTKLQQRARTPKKKGEGRTTARASEPRVLDLGNAGGDLRNLNYHRASAAAGWDHEITAE